MTALTLVAHLQLPPLWRWATKWGYFLGLAALIGPVLTHVCVIRPALRDTADEDHRRRGSTVSQRVMAVGALLMVPAALGQAAATVARAHKGAGLSTGLDPHTFWSFHTAAPKHGAWVSAGALSLTQLFLVAVCALLLAPLAWRTPGRSVERVVTLALPLTWLVTLVKAVPTGHADLALDALGPRLLTQAHIVGGSVWAGGLVSLLALTRSRHHIRDAVVDTWLTIWRRFGTVALVAVGTIVLSGCWMAYEAVGSPSQLLSTSFGLILTTKVLLVAVLVAAGALNQLVLMPRIVRLRLEGDTRGAWQIALGTFGRVVATESVLVVLVLLGAAFLNGSARAQAHGGPASPFGGTILLLGAGILAVLVALLWGTARLSELIARRPRSA